MTDVVQRVIFRPREPLQPGVVHRFNPEVDRQHGPHVGMHEEPGERAEDLGRVVGLLPIPALGVRNGHDAIELRVHPREGTQAFREQAHVARGARGSADDRDHVPRAHAAPAGTSVARKGAGLRGGRERRPRPERRLLKLVGLQHVGEVRLLRQSGPRHLPDPQGLQHRGVGDVIPGRDGCEGAAERITPREERRARRDRRDGEPMPLQHGMRQRPVTSRERQHLPRLQPPDGDGDVVPRRGQTGDGGERQAHGRARVRASSLSHGIRGKSAGHRSYSAI